MEDAVLGLESPSNRRAQIIVSPPGMEDPQPRFGIDVGDPAQVDAVPAQRGLERGLALRAVARDRRGGHADGSRYRANVREDTGELLGIASEDYRVVGNREAFALLDALIGSELHFETAGSLHGGWRVWVPARLPGASRGRRRPGRNLRMRREFPRRDARCHRGDRRTERVCEHARLGAPGGRTTREAAQRTFRFRHTGDLALKFDEAREVMGMTLDWSRRSRELSDRSRPSRSPRAGSSARCSRRCSRSRTAGEGRAGQSRAGKGRGARPLSRPRSRGAHERRLAGHQVGCGERDRRTRRLRTAAHEPREPGPAQLRGRRPEAARA